MQIPALFLNDGIVKKYPTKKTPKIVEQKKKTEKICALLKRSFDGNKEIGSTKRRTRTKGSTKTQASRSEEHTSELQSH